MPAEPSRMGAASEKAPAIRLENKRWGANGLELPRSAFQNLQETT